ncbi:MAG: alginate lyase family protein [Rhodocyclaceae bacterium]
MFDIPFPGHGRRLAVAALAFAGCAFAGSLQAHPFDQAVVKDPTASYVNVKARRTFLQSGQLDDRLKAALPKEYDCTTEATPNPQQGEMVIPRRYLSGNHGPVNPDYEPVVTLYRDFEKISATLGNLYVATGKPVYATCLLNMLDKWAKADALLNYDPKSQSWYQVEWSAATAAFALSTMMAEPNVNTAQRERVVKWLNRVARHQTSFPGGDTSCCNNHSYWRGQEATIIGVISKDDELFRWGLGRYVQAMGLINEDGSFVHEMTRHEQSLHYQNYAMLPLTMIAETASRQGIDLYAYKENGRDIHSARKFVFAAVKNPDLIKKYASEPQDTRAFKPGRGDLNWIEYQRARFGFADELGFMTVPIFDPRTGGSGTLLAYKPQGAAAQAPVSAPAAAHSSIDLSKWKLQIPVNPIDVATRDLLKGYQDKYFYVDKDGSLAFWCPASGFKTTANTKYPRSELREMLDPDNHAVNWGWQGTHEMNLRGAVMHVSPSGKTIVMQIHAVMPDGSNAPPLVKGQFYKNTLDFLVKNSAAGGKDTHYVFEGIELGKPYDAQIKVVDGVLSMTVNGQTKTVDFVAKDAGWKDLKFYFKAGNYLQDRQADGSDTSALVKLYKLDVKHSS